jgi:hypothetical protein
VVGADVDGDGDVDLAVTVYGTNRVAVLINLGNGTFAPPVDFPTGQRPISIVAADFDADGLVDFATANGLGDSVSVLRNSGGGILEAPVSQPVQNEPLDLTAADFDSDGDFDIAVTNRQSYTVSMVRSCTPSGVSFCAGDGSGTGCPCANNGTSGNGCASSVNSNGANVASSGTPSIAADTFVLTGSGMPDSSCLYFQGTTQVNGGLGATFGDGLRCVAGTIVRLGTKTNAASASQYPAAGDPSISVRGQVTAPGVRTYQVWYRNAIVYCTPSTFNLTNGCRVSWTM